VADSQSIVLGLEAHASRATIDAAALVAAHLGRDLNVLFVEDEDLLRLAQLPAPAWIAHTGTVHDLDVEIMERALRAAAARLRDDLALLAQQRKLRWRFGVRRGQLLGELSGVGSDDDLFVIPPRSLTGSAPTFGPVAALLGDAAGASRVLELLDSLSSVGPAWLLVPDAAGAETLELALGWAEGRRSRTRMSRSVSAEPDQVAHLLRAEHPALLVLSRGSDSLDRPRLRALREQAPCPLLVVR
jgi:hypothetical protein